MRFLSRLIDFATIGSQSPVRRLIAYYVVLVGITTLLVTLVPETGVMFSGERLEQLTSTPRVLEDGLSLDNFTSPQLELPDRLNLIIVASTMMVGTLLLMLPVTWVYMSAWKVRGYSQSVVQTMIILPIVVSGIVLIVRNSLALAFSLAGIVAGVRFRNTLKDPRDAVFIFLAIGVGLSAGVQAPTVGFLLSMVFNFTLLTIWRTDFGRSVLEPRPSATWSEPLSALAAGNGDQAVPDRDLVLSLTRKEANALADRFDRLRKIIGSSGKKKARYNAVLWMTTNHIADVQKGAEDILDDNTKRWRLDEVITNEGKPSELYYLVRLRKKTPADEVLTAIRSVAGDRIEDAEVILSDALAHA
jgi:hypothetical protein